MEEMQTDRITITLPKDEKDQLKQYTKKIGTNPTCFIREFIYKTLHAE